MHRLDNRLVLSPTDLTKHLACAHVTTLDLEVAEGRLPKPVLDDDALQLVFALGLAHEKDYLESLRAEGRSIVEIETAYDLDGRRRAEQATVEAMRAGVDVVYQGTFFDGAWGGQADFLLRVERPSAWGPWSYEVADTKLARRLKVPALLQMAGYAERLSVLQGRDPDHLYVVTGDGVSRPWRLVDVAAYARRVRARLSAFVRDRPATEAVPVPHCDQCRWSTRCSAEWVARDDLSLVAFLRGDHREALRAAGIATLAELAARTPEELPRAIGAASRERLVQQAAEQLRERRTGQPSYLLLPPEPRTGLLRLPPPSDGDLYLDFEGDPYAARGEGREYLAGLGDRHGGFAALWAHDRDEERALTVSLVDRLLARAREFRDMHVYHYAPYEVTALKRLVARHGVREAELDQLLRAERFVDLYAVVRQGMRISKGSYSIKKLEAFYWGAVRAANADVATALDSVVAYERWLVERDSTTLAQIEAYNRDDVESTLALHGWLEQRRLELEKDHGLQPRPADVPDEDACAPGDDELAEVALAERLHAGGHELLGDLVQWHRREARPAWWEYFRLADLDDDDLVDDGAALGPLSEPEYVRTEKRSRVWRYTFEPQDTRVRAGKAAQDVDERRAAGTVTGIDPVAGWVEVKLQGEPLRSRAFGPPGPIGDEVLRESIRSAGEDLLAGRRTLAHALLDRVVPADVRARDGETPRQAVVRVGRSLEGSVLAVQGPPGSGKTTVGAELIRALLDAGRTVGVTATSHAVIAHLLDAVDRPALHKCDDTQPNAGLVTTVRDNGSVVAALADGSARLVGGTAWLWARPDMAEAVDVLVVDEAGQFSLANAVAVARGARGLVLLGDPQQLAQPTQGLHPEGAGISALEHLLEGRDTIPPDRGIFLDTSWRMHPDITAFVSDLAYDGRLASGERTVRQTVLGGGLVEGSGLRMVEVPHAGDAARSTAEAVAVAELWRSLQGVEHVTCDGDVLPVRPADVLVVAPYNNQVAEILRHLPDGARVGTVDKFQGQEAPVVIYSMTSSSASDAPRGIDFLYDLHRLNVAVSRAQALAVVVASPALLDAEVTTPEQLRRVSALCRLRELAAPVTAGG